MDNPQETSFRRLLPYVWEHSQFYREYYGSHGITEKDLTEVTVQDLPFLTKKTLMEHFDAAVTDPRLKRKELERWAHENANPERNFADEFIVIRSSGTSGYQGTFVYDQKTWRTANLAIASRLPAPENYPERTRVAWYIDSYGRHAADLAAAVRMPKNVYEILMISLVEDPELIARRLNAFQPHRLVGYSSCMNMLADLALQGNLQIQPRRIFVSGDLLTDGMKEKLQAAWRAPVFEFYAASEALSIALKSPAKDEMDVVQDLNVVEVLDQNHRPVSPGEPGRVVLTNLYNWILPVLRYELGDYVLLGKPRDDCSYMAATLRSVKGRANDALPVVLKNGRQDSIHPLVLPIYVPGLEKIQFISRRPERVQIDYVAQSDLDVPLRHEFQQILDMKGAAGTSFSVRKVSEIANDPATGKFRLIKIENAQAQQTSHVAAETSLKDTPSTPCLGPTNPFLAFDRQAIEKSIPARFEQVVTAFPDRLAVKAGAALSYAQLNRMANCVAYSILKRRSPGSEPIGLHLEQGSALVAALLGVLKAGKFYVYLDPSYPTSRIAAILEDAQPALIVTDRQGSHRLMESWGNSIPYLNVDDLDPALSGENPGIIIAPEAPAWLLYTSGSTGRPKGIVHDHRNMLHNIMTYTNSMHIHADDRLSLMHSFNVITSAKNLLGALLNGAAVYPFNVREEGSRRLVAWLKLEKITVFHAVPSLFRQLIEGLTDDENFPDVRLVALGSEPVTRRDVEQYKRRFSSDCILVNLLGNTEMGTYRQYFVDKATPLTTSLVPAGYELEDKTVHLVDDAGREVGLGETGEIVVESRYLAVNYWRDPAGTQAAFVKDPRGGEVRSYRTGDLGRVAPDGCLTYLGRKDFQVKIRGHRVDLAEIEMVLLDHRAIKDAVVVASDDGRQGKCLTAYVVAMELGGVSPANLRSFAAEKLPDYMVPAFFVLLEGLPLTMDGKIDRERLPRPDRGASDPEATLAPRTEVERKLADLWRDVFALEQVGIRDDFFHLGGHSLLAMQIISRINVAFGVEVPLRLFLDAPTVEKLAQLVDTLRGNEANASQGLRDLAADGESGEL